MMPKAEWKKLWPLFYTFLKAGTFTFAGGLAMLPVIEKDVVDHYKLMSKTDFLDAATLAQTLPGVIAVNCACFIGKRTAGVAGMIAAVFGAIFSAFFLMLLATIILQFIPQSGPVVGAFRCIRATSAAMILSAAFTLGKHNLKSAFSVTIMLATFVLVLFLQVNSLAVILAAGIIGFTWPRLQAGRKAKV